MGPATRTEPRHSLPLTPSDVRGDRCLTRAVTAFVCAAVERTSPAAVARAAWPRDEATRILIARAASTVAQTSQVHWAQELAAKSVAEFVGALTDSAGAALLNAAAKYDLAGRIQVSLPKAVSTGAAAWILEGAPIPVPQANLTAPILGPPKKLAIIETITREVAESGAPNGEITIGIILQDAIKAQLDLSLFSNTAVSSSQPAGLLNGLTPLTASTGGGIGAALGDLRLIMDAVAAGGGGSSTAMFFGSSGRSLSLKGYFPALSDRIFGSAFIPAGTLIGIDPRALATGYGADPEISASLESVIHTDDSAPLAIGTPGSPPTVAAPALSLFQSDLVSLKCILRACWAFRWPGIAAITTGMTW